MKEQKCIPELWAEKNICHPLDKAQKNIEVFKIFSERIKQNGLN